MRTVGSGFEKLRKARINFVMSVRMKQLDGFLLNLICECYSNICTGNSILIKI
jgi:hypothetical protein